MLCCLVTDLKCNLTDTVAHPNPKVLSSCSTGGKEPDGQQLLGILGGLVVGVAVLAFTFTGRFEEITWKEFTNMYLSSGKVRESTSDVEVEFY